jgi:hypothetical protein
MHNELSSELIKRSQIDQEMRNKAIADVSKWDSRIDEDNTGWLERAVSQNGWPTISAIGEEASQAAWLLVQHADHEPDFQAKCLAMMKELPKGEVKLSNIAYLEDRVRVAAGKPQIYGTQFYKEGDYFGPRPIEDEANLETRRLAMGLETFEANKQRMIELYGHLT